MIRMKFIRSLKYYRVLLFIVLVLLTSISVVAAGVPRSEKQIPVFPGAGRDLTAEKEALRQDKEYSDEIKNTLRSSSVKIYRVNAVPDEVGRFYIEKLGAKEGFPQKGPGGPKPGVYIAPWYEVGYFSPDLFEDQYDHDTKIHDGKWFKSALTKRKPWKQGKWLQGIYFEWNIILDNGNMAQYSIAVEDDNSFDTRKKTVQNKTLITIRVKVEKSEDALEEESDEMMDEAVDQKTNELKKHPPTEKSLGVPIYPGSVFDPEHSAGMSMDNDYQYYIYLTVDTPAKVVAFYEQKLCKKALQSGSGYIIALKGRLPVPDEGLTIEHNTMFGGKFKTVITVQKQIR